VRYPDDVKDEPMKRK